MTQFPIQDVPVPEPNESSIRRGYVLVHTMFRDEYMVVDGIYLLLMSLLIKMPNDMCCLRG